MMRSAAGSCALLVGGFARTAEAQLMLDSGWAHPITPDGRASGRRRRGSRPPVTTTPTGADSAAAHARLSPGGVRGGQGRTGRRRAGAGPGAAQRVPAHGGLRAVPPAGAVPALPRTAGPDRRCADHPSCRWCGVPEAHFRCAACGFDRHRAMAVGSARTAEEIGRAFPGVSGDLLLGRLEGAGHDPATARRGRRDARRRTGRRRRVRRRPAAGRRRDARPTRSARGRGDAAPVDGGGRAGPAGRRRRAGGDRRRRVTADGAGAGALGSGRPRRPRTGRPPGAGFPPVRGDGVDRG